MELSKVGDKISKGQLPGPAIASAVQEAIGEGRKTGSENIVLSPFKQETSINGDVSIDYSPLSINGDVSIYYSPLSINGDVSIDYLPLFIQKQEKKEQKFKHQEDDGKVSRHPNEKVNCYPNEKVIEDNFAMVKGYGGWLDE
nr:hypothetical protein Iba_chr09dCG12500 [Ipomoea batatas]